MSSSASDSTSISCFHQLTASLRIPDPKAAMKQLQMCALVSQFGLTMGAKNTESAPSRRRSVASLRSQSVRTIARCGFLGFPFPFPFGHASTHKHRHDKSQCRVMSTCFVPIQLLDEMLGHLCSLLHASRCQTRVCGQVKVLSLSR